MPDEMRELGQSAVGVVAYLSNVFFWLKSDYFDGPSELKPLLHTWSLAVEEQFYILFPLLLLSIYKFCRTVPVYYFVLLIATSFTGCLGSDDNTEIETKSVIISTGASAKMLGLKEEALLLGKGVSTCATCDGFFFRDQIVTVVGGGDSAMEEALFLTKFAKKVFIIHRREIFRASQIMLNRAKENPKIEFILNTEIKKINNPDENKVTSAELFNKKTSETTELNTDAVFIAIGHIPNTQIFKNYLELNENGYILTNEGTKTNIPGVFACGDVQDWEYRQAVTAAGSGCMAAIDTERYLSNLK
mgnify:CR=1 FL=1